MAFMALPAARASGPELAATFNMKALNDLQSLSCEARTAERLKNRLPPFDPKPPEAFAAEGPRFLVKTPTMKPRRDREADRLFEELGDHIKDIAYAGGAVYVFPRVIAESNPGLASDPGYYNDAGLYIAVERRVYVPFDRAVISRGKGGITVRGYQDSSRDRARMINHESGHMIDDRLGSFSLSENTGPDGAQRLSNRKDFREAFARDMDALVASRRYRDGDVARRGYYLPASYKGTAIGGARDDEQRARREVFAELWAEANGHAQNRLSEIYPRSYKTVAAFNGLLKDLHEKAPVKCRYTQDGQAVPR